MNSLFIPLRSNAAWFANDDTVARLNSQLKTAAMLYDQLLLEDGRYFITADAGGQGYQSHMPSQFLPKEDRDSIAYFTPGGTFSLAAGDKQVLSGIAAASYQADFFPVLNKSGIINETFLRWHNKNLNPAIENELKTRASRDVDSGRFNDVLPPHRFIQKALLAGVYRDMTLAHVLNMPCSMDYHAAPVIDRHRDGLATIEIRPLLWQYWLHLEFPDFSRLHWHEVCELRDSDAGRSFREMMGRLSTTVQDAIPSLESEADLKEIALTALSKEVAAELKARVSTPGSMLLSTCLNLAPFALPSIVKDLFAHENDRVSWISLLRHA